MVDRLLIATAILTQTITAAAFVLTEGPSSSPVVLKLTATHGVHRSDVPILVLWLVGISAYAVLAWRHRSHEDIDTSRRPQ